MKSEEQRSAVMVRLSLPLKAALADLAHAESRSLGSQAKVLIERALKAETK